MTHAEDPLTPEDCDLRGMEWMPLFGGRLFMSDFEARASDEVFRAAVRLWWMAWQQVPAASLPDDDFVLCKLAGLGKDVKGWKRLRAADALHGFTLCSDGRLYHGLLAEQAREAWDRRQREREKKQRWRENRPITEKDWLILRADVFKRDNYQCVECQATENLECGYVIPASKGGPTLLENLQTLCGQCNSSKGHKLRVVGGGRNGGGTQNGGGRDRDGTGTEPGQDRGGMIAEPGQDDDGTADRTGQDRTGTGQDKEKGRENPPKPPRSRACQADPEFAAFYDAYPRHDAPDDALKAWRQVIAKGATVAEIMAGLASYQFRSDPQYVRLPAGWLRGGCWKAAASEQFDPVLRAAGLSAEDFADDFAPTHHQPELLQ